MKNIREEFPVLTNNPDLIYFDNAATSLKPKMVIDAELNFLNKLEPILYGGGMISTIDDNLKDFSLAPLPVKLEAGTLNMSGIAGFEAAIDFINNVIIINKLNNYGKKNNMSNKAEIRERFLNIRNMLNAKYKRKSNSSITKKTIHFIKQYDLKKVCVFLSGANEPDTNEIIKFCLKNNIEVYGPRAIGDANGMKFRQIKDLKKDLKEVAMVNLLK
ncbi:hypothetical protein FQA39_LY12921 [Lamprigera yunnana]|nr:hypothetical protein FQA39_LY12921 [Lamprigera yunnana]